MLSYQPARGVMPTYSGFLTTWLNNLMMLRASGRPIGEYWKVLKDFINALPSDIKSELKPKCEEIDKTMYQKLKQIAQDAMAKHILNQKQSEYATNYLEEMAPKIWSEMNDLLDAKGLKLIVSNRAGLGDFPEGDEEPE